MTNKNHLTFRGEDRKQTIIQYREQRKFQLSRPETKRLPPDLRRGRRRFSPGKSHPAQHDSERRFTGRSTARRRPAVRDQQRGFLQLSGHLETQRHRVRQQLLHRGRRGFHLGLRHLLLHQLRNQNSYQPCVRHSNPQRRIALRRRLRQLPPHQSGRREQRHPLTHRAKPFSQQSRRVDQLRDGRPHSPRRVEPHAQHQFPRHDPAFGNITPPI